MEDNFSFSELTHLQVTFPGRRFGIEFVVSGRRSSEISDDAAQRSSIVPVGLRQRK